MNEKQVLAFVGTHFNSVWALELLLLIKRDRGKGRNLADLVAELRSSPLAVSRGLSDLKAAGLVTESADGLHDFEPVTSYHEQLAVEIERIYALKPMTLVKVIAAEPNEKLRIFSDAFKLKD